MHWVLVVLQPNPLAKFFVLSIVMHCIAATEVLLSVTRFYGRQTCYLSFFYVSHKSYQDMRLCW